MQCESKLPQVVEALRPPSSLPGGLHSRQKQGRQQADNGNCNDHFEQ
jgi:hypothetical protein